MKFINLSKHYLKKEGQFKQALNLSDWINGWFFYDYPYSRKPNQALNNSNKSLSFLENLKSISGLHDCWFPNKTGIHFERKGQINPESIEETIFIELYS
jgi:hypothetical protein